MPKCIFRFPSLNPLCLELSCKVYVVCTPLKLYIIDNLSVQKHCTLQNWMPKIFECHLDAEFQFLRCLAASMENVTCYTKTTTQRPRCSKLKDASNGGLEPVRFFWLVLCMSLSWKGNIDSTKTCICFTLSQPHGCSLVNCSTNHLM